MSKIKNDLQLKYNITLEVRDVDTNEILQVEKLHNIVVNTGKSRIANLINGGSSSAFQHIAIGEDATAEVVGDTTLGNESLRELATVSEPVSGTARWVKLFTFASGEIFSLREIGVFDSATVSGSTMMNRATFSQIDVDPSKTLNATIDLVVDNCP